MSERRFFGTDGVRDIANRGSMTAELALGMGAAFVRHLRDCGAERPKILVCRDTRQSGTMIEAALEAGMMSAGAECGELGVFPTPGVSFILRRGGYDGGAVVSASHNPAEYNGIKFFDRTGSKLTDSAEAQIERYYETGAGEAERPTGGGVGVLSDASSLRSGYVDWLREQAEMIGDTALSLAIDAANGAASEIVRDVFSSWRGRISYRGVSPDGTNINARVGVMHMDGLRDEVARVGARLGIAYDGDTDRVLLCDSRGRTIDGDIIMWVVARSLARHDALGTGLVATVMSNMVLEEKLRAEGIKTFRCPVGDRYVLEKMREVGSRLGGEQSGHVIASDYAGTGDGLCTGLFFIRACEELGLDIDRLNDDFPRWPQVLRNIRTTRRDEIMASRELANAVEAAEARLAESGRVLIRPSGTEPLIRILVEARDPKMMTETADALESVVARMA